MFYKLFSYFVLLRDENINSDDCYWLSRDYYDDCCWFYKRESDPYTKESPSILNSEHKHKDKIIEMDRATPIIDANDFHTGKSNKFKHSDTKY